jgi:hypothetical protein
MLVYNNGVSSVGIFLPDPISEGIVFDLDRRVVGRPFGLSQLVIPVEGVCDIVADVVGCGYAAPREFVVTPRNIGETEFKFCYDSRIYGNLKDAGLASDLND